jgi:pimeloyl-ACP methyl ester carboxylesterase
MVTLMDQGLHYEVNGTGAPLLLIHGTGSSLRVWDPVVYLLAARRTVIAVDLPGFGFSPPMTSGPPPTPAGYARVLADLLRELGYDSAHVAGNSVGGWTALEVAKLGVARSVVALAPAGLWARRAPLYAGLSRKCHAALVPTARSPHAGAALASVGTQAHDVAAVRSPRRRAGSRRCRGCQGVRLFSRVR